MIAHFVYSGGVLEIGNIAMFAMFMDISVATKYQQNVNKLQTIRISVLIIANCRLHKFKNYFKFTTISGCY